MMTLPDNAGYEPQAPLGAQLLTWANLATSVRLVFGLAAFCVALYTGNEVWNFVGLGIYWSLDIADGWLARRYDQETLFGAQYDILADRIQVAFFYLVYASMHPDKLVVIAVFLLQFMVFDHYLSNQFLRWRVISPNYFYRVDQRVFDLLWSPIGKALNTGLVTILILVFPTIWPALAVTLLLIAVRAYCMVRVMRLPTPHLPLPPNDFAPGVVRAAGVSGAAASASSEAVASVDPSEGVTAEASVDSAADASEGVTAEASVDSAADASEGVTAEASVDSAADAGGSEPGAAVITGEVASALEPRVPEQQRSAPSVEQGA